jgi:soluble lytic murein transglycosylase-like protein
MSEFKTTRPFQERFLEGFDRSELRREVEKVKPKRLRGLRRRYATLALGASLALGGLGVPLKIAHDSHAKTGANTVPVEQEVGEQIAADMDAAQDIARSVAGGVAGGVEAAARGVQAATEAPLQAVAETPKKLAAASDRIKEDFFKKEIPFGSIIYNEAKKHDLPPELVAAVVHTESKFQPTARSGRGAVGLMQLVPRTGRWMGARDLTNPAQNIMAGTKYLRYLNDRFDGNEEKMIAAYNAGEGNVRRFGGVPPFKETRKYVLKVRDYQRDIGDRLEGRAADLTLADSGVTR